MNTQLIPVFAGELSGAPIQLVDARLLHTFLEVVTQFKDWIARRIEEYGFIENQDFCRSILSSKNGRGGHNKIVYHLTLDMAKELGMIERNEKGRQIRRYFLEIERIAQQSNNTCQLPEPPTASTARQGELPAPLFAGDIRLLVTLSQGQVSGTQVVSKDQYVLDLPSWMELAKRAGYLVIHKDDLVKKLCGLSS